ncbi:MAG: carboxypeptidase-like regulatory domain-containing protein [Thermoplasmatota archaeon]
MRSWWVILVLAAGCVSPSASDCSPGHSRGNPHCLAPSAAPTGSLRCIVVDAALHPLSGVSIRVTLAGQTAGAETGVQGGCTIAGLAPGSYVVQAMKPGYRPSQTSFEVSAGDATTVVIQMAADPATGPFWEEYHYEGIIECSANVVVARMAGCSPANAGCGTAALCNLTADSSPAPYVPRAPLAWAQSEMVWQSTQAAGNQLELAYTDFANHRADDYEAHTGPSPNVIHANASVLARHVSVSNPLTIRVFAGSLNGTGRGVAPDDCCGAGLVVEQNIDIYTVLFYGFTPPPGYLFIQDGEPHPPQ